MEALDVLDLLLVTVAIYLLLLLLRRSQAAFVLRAADGTAASQWAGNSEK